MGVAHSCQEGLSKALQKLLMPTAGTRAHEWVGFQEAEPNSLLLIGHITLVADSNKAVEVSRHFLVQGLGAAPKPTCAKTQSAMKEVVAIPL